MAFLVACYVIGGNMLALMNVCHAGFVVVAVREMAVSVGLHRGSKQQEGRPQQIGY